jgi:hypothetical protein
VQTEVDGGSGAVEIDRPAGPVRASLGSGSARVVRPAVPVTVSTGSGSVRVDRPSGPVSISTGSGRVVVDLLQSSSYRVDARSSSGGVSVHDLRFPAADVQRDSVNGRLGTGAEALTVRSGSGRITLNGVS